MTGRNLSRIYLLSLVLFCATIVVPINVNAGDVLNAVREREFLRCGVTVSVGFAVPDEDGRWTGMEVDLCRAMAVALFNDSEKAQFLPYTMQQRFSGLKVGEVDILFTSTSQTLTRATKLGFHFGPVYLYDGQGFMVHSRIDVAAAVDLDGATICVKPGTTTELNLTDFARRNRMSFQLVVVEDARGVVSAFERGRCDAITQDVAGLETTRAMLTRPQEYKILEDRISKEPIAPVVRFGDDEWLELTKWVIWSTMQAEEMGITQDNADSFANSRDPSVLRFLGSAPGVTDGLGLDAAWTLNVVKHLGNYGEIYERNVGSQSALNMPRGANRLWTDGGLIYSPPFR